GGVVLGGGMGGLEWVYGGGMAVGGLESEELAAVLEQGRGELLGPRFFHRAAKIVDMPWAISVGNDLRMPETIGPRNIGVHSQEPPSQLSSRPAVVSITILPVARNPS